MDTPQGYANSLYACKITEKGGIAYPRRVEGSGYERLDIFGYGIELWRPSSGAYTQLA